jgi:molybdopterin-biosynthesis enzyme MoeA-like protein
MSERTVTAALVIIGNEILSGRTRDENLAFLARELNGIGIQLREARIVPDAEADIVEAVNACRARHDHVFTTGRSCATPRPSAGCSPTTRPGR